MPAEVPPPRTPIATEASARTAAARSPAWAATIHAGLLVATCLFAGADAAPPSAPLPSKAEDLFRTDAVWTIHLKFTPERWATMEPKGGMNPFDTSNFGMGMFLAPAILGYGDKDKDGAISEGEFREVARRWFEACDRDGDGSADGPQLRAGLKSIFTPPGQGEGGGPPPGMTLQAKEGKRNGLSGMMGIDFEYVHADLEFEGKTFPDVAVRYKGNGTFLESRGTLKRSLKIDLNRYVKGQKLAGAATLNLHNNVTDAGMMHEALAYRLYRDAGVPAPRTAYARVFVTVPGKHDRRYIGLYSLVENVDKAFAADRKLPPGGAFFKPSTPDLFADLGDDWAAYVQAYDPKSDPATEQRRRVIDLCRLVTKGSDDDFAAGLGGFVDLDEFARFLAVSAWIGDLDGILTTGQNYYLYLDPKTGRFQFIPWDKDHTFGSWVAGDYADRVNHSIREPWEGRKRFLERAFKVPAFRDRYLAAMRRIADEHARPERFESQARLIAGAIREAVREESAQKLSRFEAVVAGKPLQGAFFGFGKPTPTMLAFARDRAAAVKEQLDGKSEGYVLGRRKPGDPKGPPGSPPLEEMVEPALLRALDADKDRRLTREEFVGGFERWFAAWDNAKAGRLDGDQLRKGLNKALPFPMFGPPRREEAGPGSEKSNPKKPGGR